MPLAIALFSFATFPLEWVAFLTRYRVRRFFDGPPSYVLRCMSAEQPLAEGILSAFLLLFGWRLPEAALLSLVGNLSIWSPAMVLFGACHLGGVIWGRSLTGRAYRWYCSLGVCTIYTSLFLNLIAVQAPLVIILLFLLFSLSSFVVLCSLRNGNADLAR